jgi:hypothetical protein
MMKKCIVTGCFLLVLSASSVAGSVTQEFSEIDGFAFTYSGRTLHLGRRDRNENNDILGIRYKELEVSTMINSFDKRSYIFAYHKKFKLNDWADAGFRVGGITGYTKDENRFQLFGVTPVISPTINFHYKGFGFETSIQTDVLIFTLNYSF